MPSRLGFGTAGIMGAALTGAGRLRLLETAWEAGIRHFDTAPLYGQGEAELLLGRFLRRRRDTVSLTSKFGLLPASHPWPMRPLIPLARVANRRLLPPLRRGLSRVAPRPRAPAPQQEDGGAAAQRSVPVQATPGAAPGASAEPMATTGATRRLPPIPYTPAMLRQQLETSLRKLQTDHLETYLLHEGHADYLHGDFLEALERLVQEGKILHYGIGAERWQSRCLVEAFPDQPWILQIPDTVVDDDTDWFAARSAGPLFTHSALRLDRPGARERLERLLPPWADLCGRDPADPTLPGELLMALALSRNPDGCVIFSSANRARIAAHAGLPTALETLEEQARAWLRQHAGHRILPDG
ncbi:MAG: aldo/keto reductase [Synechococcaceae cyanobacterium]|nr:aldo/keto reductase [Synechococcaceae cyanobacterium]